MLARGIPAKRHRASGLIDFVRLFLYAASPAGVNGGPPTLLNMPPIISGPFQNPDRSGLPSGVRGAGFGCADEASAGPEAPFNSVCGFSVGAVGSCPAAEAHVQGSMAKTPATARTLATK